MVVDDKYNVYKGLQITPDVDPEDKRSSVEILFNLRSFRAQSDVGQKTLIIFSLFFKLIKCQ